MVQKINFMFLIFYHNKKIQEVQLHLDFRYNSNFFTLSMSQILHKHSISMFPVQYWTYLYKNNYSLLLKFKYS